MTEDKVAYIGSENVAKLQPSGPEPLGWALQQKIEDAIEEFTSEHEMNVSTIFGAIELVKMNFYMSMAMGEEEED